MIQNTEYSMKIGTKRYTKESENHDSTPDMNLYEAKHDIFNLDE